MLTRTRPTLRRAAAVAAAAAFMPTATGLAGILGPAERAAIDRAIEKVYPALVRIHVVSESPGEGRMMKNLSVGSGTIVSKDGYIITNHHVAGKGRRLVCRMTDGEEIEARLVAADAMADIAVIQLDLATRKTKKPLPVAAFGDSDALQVGDTVLAMGSPGAMSQSVTKGIVANTSMVMPAGFGRFTLEGEEVGSLVRWLVHDAPIYHGNSGGPLVNLKGEIVGINEIGVANLGGAIPGNLAKSIARQMIDGGEVRRSWVGLDTQARPKSMAADRGVLVAGVIKPSPAHAAGLKSGDLIVSFDGVKTDARIPDEMPLFNAVLLGTPVGKEVAVRYLRGGAEHEARLTTEARDRASYDSVELKEWGMTVCDISHIQALQLQRTNRLGVFVSTMRVGGPAQEPRLPLEPGDIILSVDGQTVTNAAGLKAITRAALEGREGRRPVLVEVERDPERMLTVVKIGRQQDQNKARPARKPWLAIGIQPVDRDLAAALGDPAMQGIRVTEVLPGKSAEKAGLRVGDILLRMDGEPLQAAAEADLEQFIAQIRQYDLGSTVKMDIRRGKENLTLAIALDEPEQPVSEMKRLKNEDFEFTLREVAFLDRVARKLEDDAQGVLVEKLEPAGWADLAGLRLGDLVTAIDGELVPDIDRAGKQLDRVRAEHRRQVLFYVRRGVRTVYVEVEPQWENGGASAGKEGST